MWEINKFVRVTEGAKEAYPQGRGRTLAAAIRDAGVRCANGCAHFGKNNTCREHRLCVTDNFFCASHSLLTQPSEDKE